MKPIIFGASGVLGQALLRAIPGSVGTCHQNAFVGGVAFDALNMSATSILDDDEYTHAIVCIGNASIQACAADPNGTAELNVHAVLRVMEALRERKIPFAFISSESVLGERTTINATEEYTPNPSMMYARQKYAVELGGGADLVIRLCKVLHTDMTGRHPFKEWHQMSQDGRRIDAAIDQVWTPMLADDAAHAIRLLMENGCRGVYHVGGTDLVTRYRLCRTFCEESGHQSPFPCLIGNLPVSEPLHKECTLGIGKLTRDTGFRPRSIYEAVRLLAEGVRK